MITSRYEGEEVVPQQATRAPRAITCTGNETVLLIQDNVPWYAGGGQDPLGANVTELLDQGKNFCMISSSDIATTNLSNYKEIIISAAQSQAFYDNLFPGGTISKDIADFVKYGGILSANLTDNASGPGAGGNWAAYTFLSNVQHVLDYTDDDSIADPTHPIITGTLPSPSGNCGPIVDVAVHNDLDGWGFSSHGYFTNLPTNTTVIITDTSNRPVMVEYPYGKGVVIATLTTTEWRYAGGIGNLPQNKKLLANEIAYQDQLVKERMPYVPFEDTVNIHPETIQCPWNLEELIEVQGEVKIFVEKYKHSEGECQITKPGKGDDIGFTLVFGNYGEFPYIAPKGKPTVEDKLIVKSPINLKLMRLALTDGYKLFYGNTNQEVQVLDMFYGIIGIYNLQLRKYDITLNDYIADFDIPPHYISCFSMLFQIEFSF
ncbi:MAG: hypothetical protein RR324_02425 [Cellulosilyticaceae bacterium]